MASKTKTIYASASSKYGYVLGTSFTETVAEDLKASNKTKVTPKATISGKDINFSGGNNTLQIYWVDNNKHKNGTLVATKTITSSTRGVTYTAEGTIEVEHNSDGTLKGKSRAVWTKVGTSSYIPPTTTLETDETSLTTLPRATKITNQIATIGKEIDITWSKASPTFTHTLSYKVGDVTRVIGEDLVDGFTWTPPDSLYQDLDVGEIVGSLYLDTYNGDNQIGTTQEAELVLRVNTEEAKPEVIEKAVIDSNDKTKEVTGNEKIIVLLASNSIINLKFSTRKFATAKKLIIDNQEYQISEGVLQEDNQTTLYNVSVDLGKSLRNNFTISIEDSRGLISEDLLIAEDVVNYLELYCKPTFKRIQPTTGQVGLTFNGGWFNGNFGVKNNELKIYYKYKKKDETNYSDNVSLVLNTDYTITGNRFFSGETGDESRIELTTRFDYRYLYDGVLYIEDLLNTHAINFVVIKGIPIFWWNGEKVVVNGKLYIADTNGEGATLVPKVVQEFNESTEDSYSCAYINTALETIGQKERRWSFALNPVSISLKTWSAMASKINTSTIPAGKYLILFKASCFGNGNGVATINPYLDDERLEVNTRSTIPIASGLMSTTQAIVYKEFDIDSTHPINIYVYSNVSLNPQDIYVEFIRID